MTIFRFAFYRVQPEALSHCQQALRQIVDDARAREPGTQLYAVAQTQHDPLAFVHASAYRDGAALETHLNNREMLRLFGTVQPALIEPPRFEQYEVLEVVTRP